MVEKKKQSGKEAALTGVSMRAEVEALPLTEGLFSFFITAAEPEADPKAGDLLFPAVHVAPGPGCAPNAVEFIGLPNSIGAWLYRPGDKLIVKVQGAAGATLVLSSIRSAGNQKLELAVARLDLSAAKAAQSNVSAAAASVTKARPAATPAVVSSSAHQSLKLQIGLHVRNYGDLKFADSDWAGLLAENLWIEALSVVVEDDLSSREVEVKGLSANGFESPWLSDGASCGSKGRSTPLIGFAIRLKTDAMARFDCEYSGYFLSGATIGPLRNGTPCRSKTAGDPLVGVQVRIFPRTKTQPAAISRIAPSVPAVKGPQFSKFRESTAPAAVVVPAKPGLSRPSAGSLLMKRLKKASSSKKPPARGK